MPGAFYYRGILIEADTYGANKSLAIYDADTNSAHAYTGGPANSTINHNGQTQIEYAFTVPFVAHLIRDQSQDLVPWRKWGIEPKGEPWPELTAEHGPWMNLGTVGAKYLLTVVIPMDTNGQAVSLTLLSSDGGPVTLGPFTTTAAEKTDSAWAFTIPLVGHEFQIVPSAPIRIWYDQIRWSFDAWPELVDGATGWLKPRGGLAAWLQGLVVPVEAAGDNPALEFLYDNGQSVALTTNVTPVANQKTPIPYTLENPVVCHIGQLVPSEPCRIWTDEIIWISEATPELSNTWKTQPTSHGAKGYHFIYRLEWSYAANANCTLTIAATDGTSPISIKLPSTGGNKSRILITPTFNKGQLFQYSQTSNNTHQVFGGECVAWIGQWGRKGPCVAWRGLGGDFTDDARI